MVWVAQSLMDRDRKIVIKKVKSNLPVFSKSLFNEDSIMRILSAESGSTKTLGVISAVGNDYLFQEYAGETLDALAKDIVIGDEPIFAFDIADKILKALKSFDSRGVKHYDIKPSNVFYSEEGTLKLGDFGVSRFYFKETNPENNFADRKAGTAFYQPGAVVNSPFPED